MRIIIVFMFKMCRYDINSKAKNKTKTNKQTEILNIVISWMI